MIKKILLTGGPCSGKSSALASIKEEFNEKAIIVPEAASMLFAAGFPSPIDPDVKPLWTSLWNDFFQERLLRMKIFLEETFVEVAKKQNMKFVICDRGTLDGAAYTQGGITRFCTLHNLSVSHEFERYQIVIHMESLATGMPDLFSNAENMFRRETSEEAAKLDKKVMEIWKSHPCYHYVPTENDPAEKFIKINELIHSL